MFTRVYGKFFEEKEFLCKCGCGMGVEDALVKMLNSARKEAGVPFVITSGARCVRHNKAVGGSPTSSHKLGLAADIAFKDSTMLHHILRGLFAAGFKRIGINWDKNFVHVDIDYNKSYPCVFPY